jgi:FkbM family methyltransferase
MIKFLLCHTQTDMEPMPGNSDPPQRATMGRHAPLWRRVLYRAFDRIWLLREGRTPDGSFKVYVSPGCQLSVLGASVPVDPVHARFIDRWVQPDSIVWDVGGNMGLFSFPAALKARSGHVFSFEPDVDLARSLIRSLARNPSLTVTVSPVALSDADGMASFLIATYGRSMNKLDGVGRWHDDLFVASQKRSVATLRMDTVAKSFPPPNIVKIDVEGAEIKVLEGGRETISRARPVILVEGPKELWPQMTEFFRGLDYILYDGQVANPVALDEPVWDTVAVPREKWR